MYDAIMHVYKLHIFGICVKCLTKFTTLFISHATAFSLTG